MNERSGPTLVQLAGLAARKTGLTRPAWRALERYRAWRAGDEDFAAEDGLPMPPALLRVRVAGVADPDEFLRAGRDGADVIEATIARHHPGGMEGLRDLLDFGCGCGRIMRHWASLRGPRVFGCDYDAEAIDWCQASLRFATAQTNELAPPLPYAAASFDFVYAISVFTHLSEPMQHEWMAEMRRVLRPEAILLFTTKGDSHAHQLTKPGRPGLDDYEAGRLVVTDPSVEGSNLCAAFHPHDWVVREMLTGYDPLEYTPSGATMSGGQDLYVVRRI